MQWLHHYDANTGVGVYYTKERCSFWFSYILEGGHTCQVYDHKNEEVYSFGGMGY